MNRLSIFLLCGFLASCSSEPAALQRAAPRVKQELILVVPDEPITPVSSAPNPSLPDQRAVLIAPDVIAYPIAARQDPNHPDLMYGGTWAFRRTSAQWRLASAPSQDVALGPISRDDRRQILPLQNQEITASLLEQRALNDQNRQAITRLIRLQEELQKQLADLRGRAAPPAPPATKNEDEIAIPPRPSPFPESSVKDSTHSDPPSPPARLP